MGKQRSGARVAARRSTRGVWPRLGALALVAHALVAPSASAAQAMLQSLPSLVSFPAPAVTATSRPTWDGTQALTVDGRCVSAGGTVSPSVPRTTRHVALASPARPGEFLVVGPTVDTSTGLTLATCAPTDTFLGEVAGIFPGGVADSWTLDGSAFTSVSGEVLVRVRIPTPLASLEMDTLVDASDVAALLPALAAGFGPPTVTLPARVRPAAGPSDAVLGVVDRTYADASRTYVESWVFEVVAGSAPTLRAGPFVRDYGATQVDETLPIRLTSTSAPDYIVVETTRDVFFLPRSAPLLAPAEIPFRVARSHLRWPSGPAFVGLVPAPSGIVGAFVDGAGQSLHALVFDDAIADVDRDGLTTAEELALGTSDLDRDSDGDGHDDLVELELGTAPSDGLSRPAALPFDPRAQLASSPFLELERVRSPASCYVVPNVGGELCGYQPGGVCNHPCVDEEDVLLPALESGSFRTPDGSAVFVPTSADGSSYEVRDAAGATRGEIQLPALTGCTPGNLDCSYFLAFAPAADEAWFFAQGPTRRLLRWKAGALTVPLEPSACARFVGPDVACSVGYVGWDAPLGAPLAVLTSPDTSGVNRVDRTWLYRFPDGAAQYVGELSAALARGARATAIHPLASGGYILSSATPSGIRAKRAQRLDPHFRPTGTDQPALVGTLPASPGAYRDGPFSAHAYGVLVPIQTFAGECGSVGPITWCDSSFFGRNEVVMFFETMLTWHTVGDRLEPGEVVGVALELQPGDVVPPTGRSYDEEPMLFRVTRAGATVPWLDEDRLRGLMDSEDLAQLGGAPIFAPGGLAVRTLDVSPDASRVCLATGARTFELELEAGLPTRFVLADDSAGEACAYDAAGRLATVSATPHTLRTSGSTTTLPGSEPVFDLVQLGDTWLVGRGASPALCVTDSNVTTTAVEAVGIAPALTGVVWMIASGDGFWAPDAAAFCAGAPTDRVDVAGARHWKFNPVFPLTITTSRSAIVVRDDGLLLSIPRGLDLTEPTGYGAAVRQFSTWLYFPPWVPESGGGSAVLDPYRGRYDTSIDRANGLVYERYGGIAALTYVPALPGTSDWGLNGRRTLPPLDAGPIDAGTLSDGGPPRPRGESGCDCRVTRHEGAPPLSLLFAACVVALALGRRSARRAGRADAGAGGARTPRSPPREGPSSR